MKTTFKFMTAVMYFFQNRKNLSSRARLSWTSLWLCVFLAPAAWLITGPATAGCTDLNNDNGTAYSGCVDMLQGRRVISRRDWLVVNAPSAPSSGRITTHAIVYATEADNNITGIGKVITAPNQNVTPSSTDCDTVDPIPFPARSVTARMYDETRDVIVVLSPSGTAANTNSGTCESTSGNPNLRLQLYDGMTGTQLGAHKNYMGEPNYIYLAVDDFDLDGFDDILVMNDLDMRVFYAADHSDTSKQLSIGPATDLNPSSRNNDRTPINEPTTGDFNGDGVVDVAWIGGNFQDRSGSLSQNGSLSVFFASVCPGDTGSGICDGAARFEIRDLGTKAVKALDAAPLNKTVCGASDLDSRGQDNHNSTSRPGAVMLGNFDNSNGSNPNDAPIDELLVLYLSDVGNNDDDCSVDLLYFQYVSDSNWYGNSLTQSDLFPENSTGGQGSSLFQLHGQAAYLDWYGSTEQAVLGISGTRFGGGGTDNRHFPVTVEVTFDDDNVKILQYCRADALSHSTHANPVLLYGSTTGVFTNVDPAIDETIELVDEDGIDLDETGSACSNFSSTNPGDCPYNLQIALLKSQHHGDSSTDPTIILYNVQSSRPNGGSSSLKCSNDKTIHTNFLPQKFNTYDISNYTKPARKMDRGGNFLHAGDLDGTSTRVGDPTIIERITMHSQPQRIVGAPPMHIDYVECAGCSSTEKVINMSVSPQTYFAEFYTDASNSTTATSSATTSHSNSWSNTTTETAQFGTPVADVSATASQSWGAMHDNTVSNGFSSSTEKDFQTVAQTGFGDVLYYSSSNFNVYHYPLLGVTGCPATIVEGDVTHTCVAVSGGCDCTSGDAANNLCTASFPTDASTPVCNSDGSGNSCCTVAEQQINMTLSGPENTSFYIVSATAQQWYQPKHQPGQLFSYAASTDLLKQRMSGLNQLTTGEDFSPDQGISQFFKWKTGTTADTSTSNTDTHSFDTSTSLTVGTPGLDEGASGGSVSDTYDYNSSTTSSTLNTSSTTQNSTQGVTITSGNFFNSDFDLHYTYVVKPIIYSTGAPFGTPDPANQTCPADPGDDSSTAEEDCDNQYQGALVISYAVDIVDNPHGFFSTSPYTRAFDVALNHPRRWIYRNMDEVTSTDLQCTGTGQNPECYDIVAPLNTSGKDSVDDAAWASNFYGMRGLMVTVNSTDGPQRTFALQGDTIYLQAVVYNYSLTDMTDTSYGGAFYARVKASFYYQPMETNGDSDGPSVLIDTVTLVDDDDNPTVIPPWDRGGNVENFAILRTSIDSDTMLSNQHYYFWVVAWVEDDAGNVLTELDGHGLDSSFVPPDATSNPGVYTHMADVPLDFSSGFVDSGPNDLSFTNNVGLLQTTFFLDVAPASTAAAAPQLVLLGAAPDEPDLHELLIENLQVRPERASLNEQVYVSADIFSLGAPSPGVTVLLFDGQPEDGGVLFDVETLSHIRANESHFLAVIYQPGVCGRREIVVEATHAGRIEARDSVFLVVPCAGGAERICHKNRDMTVAGAALEAHLDHGDTIGACRP